MHKMSLSFFLSVLLTLFCIQNIHSTTSSYCSGTNRVCNVTTNKCDCEKGYAKIGHLYRICHKTYEHPLSNCTSDDDCTGKNRTCNLTTKECECRKGYGQLKFVKSENCYRIDDYCDSDNQCEGQLMCNFTTNRCPCHKGFSKNLIGRCVKDDPQCKPGSVCYESYDLCKKGQGSCKKGYTVVGGVCKKIPVQCQYDSQCHGSYNVCNQATSKCNCEKGYNTTGSYCLKIPNYCEYSFDCPGSGNSCNGTTNTCACKRGYTTDRIRRNHCEKIGECVEDYHCSGIFTYCDKNFKCKFEDGYVGGGTSNSVTFTVSMVLIPVVFLLTSVVVVILLIRRRRQMAAQPNIWNTPVIQTFRLEAPPPYPIRQQLPTAIAGPAPAAGPTTSIDSSQAATEASHHAVSNSPPPEYSSLNFKK